MKTGYGWASTAHEAMNRYRSMVAGNPRTTYEFRQIVQEAPDRFVVVYDYESPKSEYTPSIPLTAQEIEEMNRRAEIQDRIYAEIKKSEDAHKEEVRHTSYDELYARLDEHISKGSPIYTIYSLKCDIETRYQVDEQAFKAHKDKCDHVFDIILFIVCGLPVLLAIIIACAGEMSFLSILACSLIAVPVYIIILWIFLVLVFTIWEKFWKAKEDKCREVLQRLETYK